MLLVTIKDESSNSKAWLLCLWFFGKQDFNVRASSVATPAQYCHSWWACHGNAGNLILSQAISVYAESCYVTNPGWSTCMANDVTKHSHATFKNTKKTETQAKFILEIVRQQLVYHTRVTWLKLSYTEITKWPQRSIRPWIVKLTSSQNSNIRMHVCRKWHPMIIADYIDDDCTLSFARNGDAFFVITSVLSADAKRSLQK